MYKVIHNYAPKTDNTGTLTVLQGEVVYLVEKTNESWWLASSSDGKVGYVPKTYIQKEV